MSPRTSERAPPEEVPFRDEHSTRMMDRMPEPPTRSSLRVVSGLWMATVVLALVGAVLTALAWGGLDAADRYPSPLNALAAVVYATLGALIVRRVGNRIGWLLLAEGMLIALNCVTSFYAVVAIATHPGTLPAAKAIGTFSEWGSVPLVVGLAFILLVFPTGTLPSRRWRPVAWFAVAIIAVGLVGFLVTPRQVGLPAPGGTSVTFPNPFGLASLRGATWALLIGTMPSLAVATAMLFVAAFAGLVTRYRSGDARRRGQIKWVAYGAGVFAVLQVVLAIAFVFTSPDSAVIGLVGVLSGFVVLVLLPVAITIAVLTNRLYDIDVIINRTVVYGLLAAAFTAVYVLVVVGIGALLGRRGGPVLTVTAAAAIAMLFQPLRRRAQRVANRLVYGERATPYQVLSDFAGDMAGTLAIDDVLARMAAVMADGTGAIRADVWIRVGDELLPAAAWPDGSSPREPIRLGEGDDLPAFDGATRSVAVRQGEELLGALAIEKPKNEPLTPTEDELLQDLASQAGLVLRNVRLTAELRANIEELKASRRRLVEAQDSERRRIERNLHDGAQQQLVALSVQLGLLDRVADDPARVRGMTERLRTGLQGALEDLRDLARGIYPPLLADKGLAVALEAQGRKASIPVTIQANGLNRYPQEIEAAVYFCVLEAMQNVAKYADARHALVRLAETDGHLRFEVEDDGRGFDPARTRYGTGLRGMIDRLEAIGGSLDVTSEPGGGTLVRGRIALR